MLAGCWGGLLGSSLEGKVPDVLRIKVYEQYRRGATAAVVALVEEGCTLDGGGRNDKAGSTTTHGWFAAELFVLAFTYSM